MALWHDTTFAGRTGRTRVWSTPTPTWNWPFGTCPTRTSTSSAISGAPSLDRYRKNRWSDLRDSSNNWNQVRSPMHFIFSDNVLNVLKPFSLFSLHSAPLREKSLTKIYPDMEPPAKLSCRSAIHKKVVLAAGDAWTLPQIQGEVGGDQEPPGNTWRYPMGSKIFLLILNHIWATIHVL